MDDAKLDTLLTAWAQAPVAPGDAGAAADAALGQPQEQPRRWWPAVTGGALAASLAIGLIVARPAAAPAPAVQTAAAAPASAADEESYAYKMTFTETPDEETMI